MEPIQRNLMIGYAVVCFLSLIGVSLNLVSVVNISNMDAAQINEDMASGLRSGFFTIASIYLLLLVFSLVGILKKTYTRNGLIFLILFLLVTFVFGRYIFEFYLGSESI